MYPAFSVWGLKNGKPFFFYICLRLPLPINSRNRRYTWNKSGTVYARAIGLKGSAWCPGAAYTASTSTLAVYLYKYNDSILVLAERTCGRNSIPSGPSILPAGFHRYILRMVLAGPASTQPWSIESNQYFDMACPYFPRSAQVQRRNSSL